MGSSDTYARGLAAETMAAFFLRLKGYRILAKRFKTPVGEIDLVARRGRTVAFVEVKCRCAGDSALYAVLPHSMERIRRAAQWWLQGNRAFADKCDIRFDVMAVAPYRWIRHIQNAF